MDSHTTLLVAFCIQFLAFLIVALAFVIRTIRAETEHEKLAKALRDYTYRPPEAEVPHGDWPNAPRH